MITNTTAKMTYTFTEGITEYAVGFVYQTNPDGSPQIKVYINDAVNTPLVYGTDYTMSLDGTKVVIASGAEVGDSLTIIRNIPIVQLSDYVVGRIDPEQIENDFDLCVERDQQQSARITVTEEQLAAHDERISDIEEVVPESAATDNMLATVADIPTVNDTTITFTQGGTTKGTITLNQASAATIAFDAGGSGAVDSVNGYTGVVVLAASDVGALPDSTTIPDAQIQSDWDQSDSTKVDYIKNKPSIPAAQVNADWDAVSGVAQILNKPTIPTVNDSTITITQGGVTKGSFTLNQASGDTIALDAGGGSVAGQSIDAEIVGTLTQDGSSFSGFSSANYLTLPSTFDFGSTGTFEIVLAVTPQTTGLMDVFRDTKNNSKGLFVAAKAGDVAKFGVSIDTYTYQTVYGVTTLSANTKYFVKVVYDGTNYTLYLSTDGATYTQEATAVATQFASVRSYQIGTDGTYGYGGTVHMDGCYIKKNAQTIWSGMDAPGLTLRVPKGHEVVEYQAPLSSNNYTWYRKYADGWVEQGGRTTITDTNANGVEETLPVTMSNTYYSVTATPVANDGTWISVWVEIISASKVRVDMFTTAGNRSKGTATWEVRGIAATN